MLFGIDRLISSPDLLAQLKGLRIGLVAHPASVDVKLTHTIDLLMAEPAVELVCAFGPQHGIWGDQQDNMMETADTIHPKYGIPIYSLYGDVRRPSAEMLADVDLLLVDLQDIGCRIYTYCTTLCYMIDAASEKGIPLWVLDRPNPAGRAVEGLRLRSGWESFVGIGPLPMQHGLTLGELGAWYIRHAGLTVDYQVVPITDWQPTQGPGYGWPLHERSWVNPSPNVPNHLMPRCYPGTVMLEGTTLSEGRGTTRPMELFGAPDLDPADLLQRMARIAPQWMSGVTLRPCWFEPTFHKHAGALCAGLQWHVDGPDYLAEGFKPYRLMALTFKAIRQWRPDYPIWRDFPYEYEFDKLAIDVINGSPLLREWVDDDQAAPTDLEAMLLKDEADWQSEVADLIKY